MKERSIVFSLLNKLFLIIPALFVFFCSEMAFGQNFNRPISPDMLPYSFIAHQEKSLGYYITSPFKIFTFNPDRATAPKLMIFDSDGYVMWYRPQTESRNASAFNYDAEQNKYTLIDFVSLGQVNYTILDSDFAVQSISHVQAGVMPDNHEFFVNKAGNRVFSAKKDSIFDLSGDTISGAPGSSNTVVVCFVIQEVDAANNLVWEWNSCDHIHPREGLTFYGYSPGGFDYCHGNSIDEDEDGNYIVSLRHMNAIIKIDRGTGNLLWQLGGKSNEFAYVNDGGFSGQHDVRRLENGRISLFDNGNMAVPPRSRGLEYELDTVNWTATKVAEYIPVPSVFGRGMGSYSHVGGFRNLGYGIVYAPSPGIETVDAAGQLVHQFFFSDSVQSYRCQLAQPKYLPARPAITCRDSAGQVILSAAAGHARYLWSTGDTTASILAAPNTEYMYWVPQGVGMLGSQPLKTDGGSHCPPPLAATSPQIAAGKPAKLRYITDLLGRRITQPLPGQIYIYYYTDQSRRKVLQIE
ncbi:MAG TPA: hypothetical protein ENJ82_17080 [Bacteroidetes bacterium]|nr:hypothetical protein [Bacteroidota bacterium]